MNILETAFSSMNDKNNFEDYKNTGNVRIFSKLQFFSDERRILDSRNHPHLGQNFLEKSLVQQKLINKSKLNKSEINNEKEASTDPTLNLYNPKATFDKKKTQNIDEESLDFIDAIDEYEHAKLFNLAWHQSDTRELG